MSLNPNAASFTLRPNAQEWKPSWSTPATTTQVAEPAPIVPTPVQTNIEVKPPTPPIENKIEDNNNDNDNVEGDEEMDENDPLWIATLKLTNGDRKEALKLLEDPDALMQYPEIAKIITENSGEDDTGVDGTAEENELIDSESKGTADDWEKVSDNNQKDESISKPSKSALVSSTTNVEDGEDTPLEPEIEIDGDPRDHMNLVFIGHVDAGKSTLSGSILYLMGKVDSRTIERFEREAKQRNRESWFLAFIMDTSEEERAKGKTVEVGRASFETPVHRYTILDAPGHKNYVPNMISGATQADIGVLVISARRGEFETGFEKGGQTREHALLAKTLGVRFLVVVINKMDDSTVNWEQERFDECVNKLKPFLKTCGYAIKRDVRFIPISGLNGANILNEVSPTVCPWWSELCASGANNTTIPTLIGTLDAFSIADRNPDGPLRIPVLDRYIERGLVVMGKVESGTLRVRDEVAILPTRRKAVVEGIYSGDVKLRYALPGENVLIKFSLNLEDVQKGYVLSSLQKSCPAVREFVIQLALVDMVEHRPVFTSGYDCVMHLHTAEIEVTCVQLLTVTDKKGVESQRRFAKQGEMCTAKFVTPLTVCMETFANMPALGRITLRDEGKTIAIGKIIKLYKPKPT